jgi:hypothetical protein
LTEGAVRWYISLDNHETMARKPHHWLGGEMIVLGAFAATTLAGLAYGAVSGMTRADLVPPVEPPPLVAPLRDDYRAETVGVMADFWEQSAKMTRADLRDLDPRFVDIITKTQERLLRVRVPREERDAHLSFVLLLDQWKRALDGSVADQEKVFEKSEAVLTANPWVVQRR